MTEYYVWLQMCLGAGSAKLHRVLGAFETPKNLYDSKNKKHRMFTDTEQEKFSHIALSEALKTVETCDKKGIKIITPESENYPKRLLNMVDPPIVLYYKGEFPHFDDEVAVAMVGARRPTPLGIKSAISLSARLSRAGCLVISGGAYGIDKYSHLGTLATGSKAVCVLPCGLDIRYLVSNTEMYANIEKRGCLISEYPPNTEVTKSAFKARNRIMSALALGVVIIEAGNPSGTLMTANHAAEQGKDVFVIPGPIGEANYLGSNKLISDGARTLLSAEDIVREYAPTFPHKLNLKDIHTPFSEDTMRRLNVAIGGKPQKQNENVEKTPQKVKITPKNEELSDKTKAVYEALGNEPTAMDAVVMRTKLSGGEVLTCLTELEILGYIECLPGNRYEIK